MLCSYTVTYILAHSNIMEKYHNTFIILETRLHIGSTTSSCVIGRIGEGCTNSVLFESHSHTYFSKSCELCLLKFIIILKGGGKHK